MDKALILAMGLKTLRGRVDELVATSAALSGKDGVEGPMGLSGAAGLQGAAGAAGYNGKNGVDGKEGLPGSNGVSIVDVEVDLDGTLSFMLSDGSSIKTTTEVVGAKGDQGPKGERGPSGITDDGIIYAFLFGAD